MAKKRSAQLDQEIRAALAKIPRKPSLRSREELDAEIDAILAGGLPAERHEIARALGFQYPKKAPPKTTTVTDLNVFALTQAVLEGGGKSTFSSRLPAVHYPHVKRALAGGLVEISSPTTLSLTSKGKEVVLRHLRKDYAAQSDRYARSPEPREKERLLRLETAIQSLESGT